jgi:hypothetical protein
MTTTVTIDQVLESIYASLHANNQNLDQHIAALKGALAAESKTSVVTVDPTRLPQNNRQGRKIMQAYFRQRGVVVTFPEK